jgi:hypothetical protein
LTDAVSAVHRLEIGLWIPAHPSGLESPRKSVSLPVTVIKDDDIGRRQVDTQATSTGGQEEDKSVASLLVVFVNGQNTVLVGSAPIDPTVL